MKEYTNVEDFIRAILIHANGGHHGLYWNDDPTSLTFRIGCDACYEQFCMSVRCLSQTPNTALRERLKTGAGKEQLLKLLIKQSRAYTPPREQTMWDRLQGDNDL